jgi:hypothetical protein
MFVLALLFLQSCTGGESHEAAPQQKGEERTETPELQAVATLRPKEGQIGNGFAELQCFHDRCVHTMRVNLVTTSRGHYQAWIIAGETFIPTGILEEGETEAAYFLHFEGSIPEAASVASLKTMETMVTWEPPNDEHPDLPYEEIVHGAFTVVEGAKR